MKYVHTNLIAKDWKKLADFYINVFDCQPKPPARNQQGTWLSEGTGVKNAHLFGMHLTLPGYGPNGPTLEIYQYSDVKDNDEMAPNQMGFGHLAFEVSEVGETLDKMIKFGGKIQGNVVKRLIDDLGTITFVYARDPEGNLIELQHWD